MTPEIKNQLDEIVDALLPLVSASQQIGSAMNNGRPVQALKSHTTIPVWPNAVPPDRLNTTPSYSNISWEDVIDVLVTQGAQVPEAWRVAVVIDSYETSQANGYVVRCSVILENELWEKAVNFGPLESLNSDWTLIPEEEEVL